MVNRAFSFAPTGAVSVQGIPKHYVDFTLKHQLLNPKTWADFVRVFRSDSDIFNAGWRCEFWGKMMRGACLIYALCKDENLYAVLEETVCDMLTVQRADGRFSTYPKNLDLRGWDVWGRKYVLTAMLHFFRICKDESLKKQIIDAMMRHADAMIEEIGDGDGKTPICKTSDFWGGANSCSVLDAVLDLYRLTEEKRYLEFGEYIISTGGCIDGSLIEAALKNEKMPYEYPEVKAYETMSFFEGLLTYYEITGNKTYLTAFENFIHAVDETDITVIGCSGCTHELFDHSVFRQTEYAEQIMQETCVTVTWMRILTRYYLLTGDPFTLDRIETSAWNALYGSTNDNMLEQNDLFFNCKRSPLPFDSYAPLYANKRGRGVGGLQSFDFGGHYGCCACIAAAGIAVYPLTAVTESERGTALNHPLTLDAKNTQIRFSVTSDFPADPKFTLTVNSDAGDKELAVRIPTSFESPAILFNGKDITPEIRNGFIRLCGLKCGDTVSVEGHYSLRSELRNGRIAFRRGPLVLARDQVKESTPADLTETLTLARKNGEPVVERLRPEKGEILRLSLLCTDGTALLLTDYQSCGKRWDKPHSDITVWMNIR